MNAETLRCAVCSKEVRIVRLNRTTLAFGHTQNPGPASHRVQLARSGQAPVIVEDGGNPVPSEALNRRRGVEAPQGVDASPRTTKARSRSGRTSGVSSPSTARRRVAAGSPPGSGSASPRSAGAL